MNFQKINERLLSHPGARKEFHEKWGWMVYWVGEKQFACEFVAAPNAKAPYAGRHLLSLKCNPERIIELRNEFPEDILPGTIPMEEHGSRLISNQMFLMALCLICVTKVMLLCSRN